MGTPDNSSLFDKAPDPGDIPLAARMRPRTLDEFVGQDHIVGPGRLLRRAIAADQLSSLIFYGPPGTGKTTLARVIANNTQSRFITLNAVLAGVADIRREVALASDQLKLHGRKTILFVDEVHRWNKSQQDALLPWVENGTVVLIGATTENPYFEVNKALVSRSRVFQLMELTETDLLSIARQTLDDPVRGYGRYSVSFEAGALEHLVHIAAGDARSLLGALQLAIETGEEGFPPNDNKGKGIHVSLESAEESIQRKVVLYDKEGDYHFDTISAFIKSIRGSDPDAALYWMALMIRAGEDPRYIFRRMLISASEDIGLAAPEALGVVESCAAAFDRVGLPEGQFHLAQAALYLSTCLKSNSTLGYYDALKSINQEKNTGVPNHLRDASRDKESFGHGEGYKYPHAWKDHWVAQQYLPTALRGRIFYQPGELGYEGQIKTRVEQLRLEQIGSLEDSSPAEVLSFTPPSMSQEQWLQRTESATEHSSRAIRDALLSDWSPKRHERVLVLSDPGAAMVWYAARKVPEGGVLSLCPNQAVMQALASQASGLPAMEQPVFQVGSTPETGEWLFDTVLGRNSLARAQNRGSQNGWGGEELLSQSGSVSVPGASLYLAEPNPGGKGTRLGSLLQHYGLEARHAGQWLGAEESVMTQLTRGYSKEGLEQLCDSSSWSVKSVEERVIAEQRVLYPGLLDQWLDESVPGSWAFLMQKALGQSAWTDLGKRVRALLAGRRVRWEFSVFLLHGTRS